MNERKTKTHRWADIRAGKMSRARVAELESKVEAQIFEMDLREIREMTGRTQAELAEAAEMTQGEVSRLERRDDHRLSTLKRIVEALGGEIEVIASFGDKRVRLKAVA